MLRLVGLRLGVYGGAAEVCGTAEVFRQRGRNQHLTCRASAAPSRLVRPVRLGPLSDPFLAESRPLMPLTVRGCRSKLCRAACEGTPLERPVALGNGGTA